MLIDDVSWIFRGFFRRFRYKATDIRAHLPIQEGDIRLRARRVAFAQLLLFLLPYSYATLQSFSGGASFGPASQFVSWLWAISLALYFLVGVLGRMITRAVIAYAAASLVGLPLSIALSVAGAQSYAFLSHRTVLPLIALELTTVLIALALNLGPALNDFTTSLAKRRYRSWLYRADGNWNPDFVLRDIRGTRVGCLVIMLSTIAVPLGLHLRRLIGRDSAAIVASLLCLSLGAFLGFTALRSFLAFTIGLRRLERKRSIRVSLPAYKADVANQTA